MTQSSTSPALTSIFVAAVAARMLAKTEQFNRQVIGLPIPSSPQLLSESRLEWALSALNEELAELNDAHEDNDILEAADALIDVIYFALGRLVEMGLPAQALFDEVQRANMEKIKGELSKRPGSLGYDAVKPEGWTPPNHEMLLAFKDEDIEKAKLWDSLSPVIKKVALLRIKKGNDYNTGIQLGDYFPFGHFSYAQMVHLKSTRMLSQIEVLNKGKALNYDGIQDTLEDMINYATFYAEWIAEQAAKPQVDAA